MFIKNILKFRNIIFGFYWLFELNRNSPGKINILIFIQFDNIIFL